MNNNKKKYRVIPNLSLRGDEILRRLNNGSLQLTPGGQYNLDPEIDRISKLNKMDAIREARLNAQKIEDLKAKANSKQK